MAGTVQLDVHDGDPVALLTVDRPATLNAIDAEVLADLQAAVTTLEASPAVRVVVLTGRGRAFVAGGDIAHMARLPVADGERWVRWGQTVLRRLERLPQVSIAAVNGYALGGGLELALACDLVVASQKAKVGQPEVNLGIIPGFGGTQRLVQRCGIGTARRLCYTGDLLDAEEALRLGVVDKVVPHERLLEEARAVGETIASKGPLAVSRAKEVIRRSQETMLLSGLRLEVEAFLALFQSADREEGMSAFLDKRKPTFGGR
jgi:enoyl-CoA hydratase